VFVRAEISIGVTGSSSTRRFDSNHPTHERLGEILFSLTFSIFVHKILAPHWPQANSALRFRVYKTFWRCKTVLSSIQDQIAIYQRKPLYTTKLSRQARLPSLNSNIDSVDLAHLYLHGVYRNHGLHRVLISDRNVRFTSLFWTALMKRLGVTLNLSTAYHAQTDGQSERTIDTLEDMIRPYVCYL
jgi:hypothetical protein